MGCIDLSSISGDELFESLTSIIEELVSCDDDYKDTNKDEAQRIIEYLKRQSMARHKIFKQMCITLAVKCGCPLEAKMKFDSNDRDTLSCNKKRCITIKAQDKTNMCWNVYFYKRQTDIEREAVV